MSDNTSPIRVLVATSGDGIADRVKRLLSSHETVQVAGTARTVGEVVQAAQDRSFEVLVTDLDLDENPAVVEARRIDVDGRMLQLVRIRSAEADGADTRAVRIDLALLQTRPFSREDFLVAARAAQG